MTKFKIVESFPQSTVRLIHYIDTKKIDKEEYNDVIEAIKENPAEWACLTEQEIDFGGEACTESFEKIKRIPKKG